MATTLIVVIDITVKMTNKALAPKKDTCLSREVRSSQDWGGV